MVDFPMCHSEATTTSCRPLLWPAESALVNSPSSIPQKTLDELLRWSKKLSHQSANPVPTLGSSGKTSINDVTLVASRQALKDADHAAVLALTYRLTHQVAYFNNAREIILRWALVNVPTGNPIDETRLDGMIWAYDLIACDLSSPDKNLILNWFNQIRSKKEVWRFGKVTSTNNHRIHQLKMLLMLDKVLMRRSNWEDDINNAEKYATLNLSPQSGVSVDYIQRNALHYHNYVMQPWLEISLMTGCCEQTVKRAFSFLRDKLVTHDIHHEFVHSTAKIDKLRAKGGFDYAKTDGQFDIEKAAPTIVSYYTLVRTTPEPDLWLIQQQAKPSPKMVFLRARRILWQP